MIHTTIGVYPNGDYKINGVESKNLAEHINYNINNRFGRMLIVDGFCVYAAGFKKEEVENAERHFLDFERNTDTAPYV